MFDNFYKGKRVLITGHTGFKGSWLSQWLLSLGAFVHGYSLGIPTFPSHYRALELDELFCDDIGDLLDKELLYLTLEDIKPDIVFHLAADAIVPNTFLHPAQTFETNVMGAVNILEACKRCSGIRSIVMITTDKVYSNREWSWGYRECDTIGDTTPYGASKVCVEQVIDCYRTHFLPQIATARAGNVIGGGDWAPKRLIPDIVRAAAEGRVVDIHTPHATRPWQHVLEPLAGYLTLAKGLYQGSVRGDYSFARPWNFGPTGEMTVSQVLRVAMEAWPKIRVNYDHAETHPSMVELLKIDSTEAIKKLGWNPVWGMEEAIKRSISWYRRFYEDHEVVTDDQIRAYSLEEDW